MAFCALSPSLTPHHLIVVFAFVLLLQEDGSKRTIRGVFRRLKRLGYDVDMIWREIGRLAVKTIIAILPELKVEHDLEIPRLRPGLSCFQVTIVTYMYSANLQLAEHLM